MKFKSISGECPEKCKDIIGLNINTGQMEFGFVSQVDIDNGSWADGMLCDFSYEITHWAYAEMSSV